MREILFRGKRKYGGTEWFEGDLSYLVHNKQECYIFPSDGYNSPDYYEVEPDTVGQYTGLTDKNGVKVFESDIVKIHDKIGLCLEENSCIIGYVDFEYGSFVIKGTYSTHYRWMDYECEVIGNVYDNSELLNGRKENHEAD